MAGIPDMLTDIRTTGQGVPMGGQPPMGRPPMGGPPPGQPPMARPPMGGGIASMSKPPMGGQPPMGGGQPPMKQPPMGMEEPPVEESMSVEKDGAMLAEATIGRTGGDTQAAIDILDTAKAMLMSSGQEDPMMMMNGGSLYREEGGPMYANMGRPLYKEDGGELNPGLQALQRTNPDVVDQILKRDMGGPLYAQEGMPLTDSETMKQMIMNGLATTAATANSQTGRALSEKDINFQKEMMSDMNYQDALDMLVKQRQSSNN